MKSTSPLTITISRQLGSGGAYIGKQLAKKLNILYADNEIICQVAKQLSVLEEDLELRDEKIASFWESFLQFCTFCNIETYNSPLQPIVPTSRELFKEESKIIEHIAKECSAVIIGRCGSHILQNHPNHVSIFLHGSFEFRKKRIQKIYRISEKTAADLINKSDIQRTHYHKTFTQKQWTDANQYDISMDTSKIGISKSIELILKYLDIHGCEIKPDSSEF